MKMKFFTALTLVFATVAAAFASDYKDGIDYFNAGQIENAKTILERMMLQPIRLKHSTIWVKLLL